MTDLDSPPAVAGTDHVDVLIVGAGLSGVGAAYRLQTECPGKTYAILEGRTAMGGTWDLFRYPGIRSDSDMYTLGYPFRPWTEPKAIADGASIRHYIEDTAAEFGIDRHIRYEHKVISAAWDTASATWTVEVAIGDDATPATLTCAFLYLCSGYYSYESGYTPEFAGRDRFQGQIVHPQQWPEDLDYAGKRVVVIGSGATAITLVPSMAETAGHVTMLQRSPTYIASLPLRDPIARGLEALLPERLASRIVKWKNVAFTSAFYQFARRRPKATRRILRVGVKQQLPAGYDLDTDFNPSYDPWDQRLCVVPDGDLFKAIKDGRASIATDTIETFDETGITLTSGRHLDADIIVTATGLRLLAGGGIRFTVDGQEGDLKDAFVYKGFMISDVPNLAMCVGYTNASWTLRADISSMEVCRVLNHLDAHGYRTATPVVQHAIREQPLLDLTAGYIKRGEGQMPRSGDKRPWKVRQNFVLDLLSSKLGDVTESLVFDRPAAAAAPRAEQASEPAAETVPV